MCKALHSEVILSSPFNRVSKYNSKEASSYTMRWQSVTNYLHIHVKWITLASRAEYSSNKSIFFLQCYRALIKIFPKFSQFFCSHILFSRLDFQNTDGNCKEIPAKKFLYFQFLPSLRNLPQRNYFPCYLSQKNWRMFTPACKSSTTIDYANSMAFIIVNEKCWSSHQDVTTSLANIISSFFVRMVIWPWHFHLHVFMLISNINLWTFLTKTIYIYKST